MTDINKIKRNLSSMVDQGASELELVEYMKAEGITPDQLSGEQTTPANQQPLSDDQFYQPEAMGPKAIGMGPGIARSALQGLSMASSDEGIAAAKALLGKITGDGDYGDLYNKNVAEERQKLAQFRKESPWASGISEVAGALPTIAVPWLSGPRAVSLLGRVATGGATAATQGGVYGFNAGKDNLSDRLESGIKTAVIAGPIGAAAPALTPLAKRLVARYQTGKAAKAAGLTRGEYDILTRAMKGDDSIQGAGATRLRKAGPNAMVADAGVNSRALLDEVISHPGGQGSRIASDAVEQRVAETNTKLTGAMDDVMGAPKGVKSTARGIASTTREARTNAYDKAYSKPINYASAEGRKIEATLARIPSDKLRAAVKTANDDMQIAGVKNQQILIDIADDGNVVFREMPNVRQLDSIKQALGNAGADAVDNFGRKTNVGNQLTNLARDVKTATSKAVPEYGKAVKLGGDKIERDSGLRLGQKILKNNTTREDVADEVARLGGNEQAMRAMKNGLRTYIDDSLATVKRAMTDSNMDAREAAKLIRDMSSRANREKVTMVLGERDANILLKEIDRAGTAFELRAAVATNSKTHVRNVVRDANKKLTEDGPINAIRAGEPVGAGKKLWQILMGSTEAAKAAKMDKVYEGLAKTLTGPRGDDARRRLLQIRGSQTAIPRSAKEAGRLTELLIRNNARVTAPINQR